MVCDLSNTTIASDNGEGPLYRHLHTLKPPHLFILFSLACFSRFALLLYVLVIYTMEARITAIFRSILQDTDEDELSRLVDATVTAGIRTESDLKYITQDDIHHVLPPIQVRKLLQHLSSACIEEPATADSDIMQASTSVANSSTTAVSESTYSAAADNDWVTSFKIPWTKCQESLLLAVDKGEKPSAGDMRQLIMHTVSDICCFTRRASRQNLRLVARKIVARSPTSFADYVNGKVIADGVNSIMLMLESKKENMNRSSVSSDSLPYRKRKSAASQQYGCSTWEPCFPPNETGDSLEDKRMRLLALFASQPESPEVGTLMNTTFCLQRQQINTGLPVSEILNKWPFLGKSEQLLSHFCQLTSIDITVCLRSAIQEKATKLYDFFSTERQTNSDLKRQLQEVSDMMKQSNEHLHSGMFLLLMAYFREKTNGIICFEQVWIYADPGM